MITNQHKYNLGAEIAKTRTQGRSTEAQPTKAEQGLRDQVQEHGGWDTDVQLGYDDALREHVQTRTPPHEELTHSTFGDDS